MSAPHKSEQCILPGLFSHLRPYSYTLFYVFLLETSINKHEAFRLLTEHFGLSVGRMSAQHFQEQVVSGLESAVNKPRRNTLLKEGVQESPSGADLQVPVSCHSGTRQPYNCGKQLLISVSLDFVLLLLCA